MAEENKSSLWAKFTDLQILIFVACIRFVIHLLANNQYGFHQDALAFLANGQALDWGYVAYPPLTPLLGRIGLELFGPSLVGIKAFAAGAQCIAMVFTGLMAKEFGGGRMAQVVASVAAGIGIMSLGMSTLFQYISFDYLWWVLIFYCLIRLLKTENPRWWIGIGTFIGLGMITKYTMAFLVVCLVVVVLITPKLRRDLTSVWLWVGVGLSILIVLPNIIWQIQHNFITLDFLSFISARDQGLGRSDGYFAQQFYVNLNPVALPLFLAGIYFYFTEQGKPFRPIVYLYFAILILFAIARGRFYYAAPLYPMIIAAGAVVGVGWMRSKTPVAQRRISRVAIALLIIGAGIGAFLFMPIAPVGSAAWTIADDIHDNYTDQIGWEELVETTAEVYTKESASHQNLAIMTSHYGSVSAFHIYGSEYDLPTAISPVNGFWLRGYGPNLPDGVLTIGFELEEMENYFSDCRLVGRAENKYGIEKPNPEIYVCQGNKASWDIIWGELQRFS